MWTKRITTPKVKFLFCSDVASSNVLLFQRVCLVQHCSLVGSASSMAISSGVMPCLSLHCTNTSGRKKRLIEMGKGCGVC